MDATQSINIFNVWQISEEVFKTLFQFLSVLVTVGGAAAVGYYARKAPVKAVKLEQLKLIEKLTHDKAWKRRSNYFVIEEAFRQYFGVRIPIDIIKLLCITNSRYNGFYAYSKVGGSTRWDENKRKVLVLSRSGIWWYVAGRICLGLVALIIASIFGSLAISTIENESDVNQFIKVSLSSLFGIGAGFSVWLFWLAISRALDFPTDLIRFKLLLEGHIVSSERRGPDIFMTIFCAILIILFITTYFLLSFL